MIFTGARRASRRPGQATRTLPMNSPSVDTRWPERGTAQGPRAWLAGGLDARDSLGSRTVRGRGASCSWTTTPRVPRHSCSRTHKPSGSKPSRNVSRRLAENWDEVHLDHDLGGRTFVDTNEIDCGMEVIRWLCEEPRTHLRETLFFVHTHNSVAGLLMVLQMRSSGYKAEFRPFGFELARLARRQRAGRARTRNRRAPAGHAVAPVARMAAVVATARKLGTGARNEPESID